MAEPETSTDIPWLGIAIALAAAGAIVVLALAGAEPPGKLSPPALVQHQIPDLGTWDPFVRQPDAGRSQDGGSGTDAEPNEDVAR